MSKTTKNRLALLALAGLSAVASGPASAAGMTVDSKGGLEVFSLDDSDYWFKLGGRIFVDQAFFDTNDNSIYPFPSGADIRSARLNMKGGVGNHWVYKLELNFVDGEYTDDLASPGLSKFGEVFIGYAVCDDLFFSAGQISVPFGLENWASASDLPFMEMSVASDAFAPYYGIGLYGEWHGDFFTFAATAYHPGGAGTIQKGDVISTAAFVPGAGPDGSAPGSDPWGVGGRLTFAPVHDDFTVYHGGVSYRYESMNPYANSFNYIAGLEVRSRQTPDIFTNIPPNSTTENNQVWGLELAGRWGPFILQGEYMHADVSRDDVFIVNYVNVGGGDLDFYGYYVEATYVLTGETREYDFDTGTFGRVHPSCRNGAWELGVRYSYVDLIDNQAFATVAFIDPDVPFNDPTAAVVSDAIVGAVHSTTIGLTWWVSDNVRFLANYSRMDLPNNSDANALGFRAQVNW